ncbi:MAG: hypothetical protein QM778_26140 [Myxococcales bacterium]
MELASTQGLPGAPEVDERQKFWAQNFTWLVRLRWVAVLAQAATVIAVRYIGMEFDAARLFALVGLAFASNIACMLWLKRGPHVREWMLAAIMAFDFVVLTALLHASGGPSNPFTVLFLVHIALAAVVLKATYAWSLAGMAMGCFFALFVLPGTNHSMAMHHHMGHPQSSAMALHLQGMWVAFAIAAAVIAYFVTRVTHDLRDPAQRGGPGTHTGPTQRAPGVAGDPRCRRRPRARHAAVHHRRRGQGARARPRCTAGRRRERRRRASDPR